MRNTEPAISLPSFADKPNDARQGCAKPDSETSPGSETNLGAKLDSRIPSAIYFTKQATKQKGVYTMEDYRITIKSFGSDVPENWQEIADYLNEIIRDRGIENNHNEVNEVWEAFWQGEFADAPIVRE